MGDIIDISRFDKAKLSKALEQITDESGTVEPEPDDIKQVEREHPNKTGADKWRHAQAYRLLRAYEGTRRK